VNDAILTPAPPSAAIAPRHAILHRPFRAYEWIARRELLACAVLLFLTLGIRAALLPWFPPPLPSVHDEFSYLLGADTFASGRVANPPHPMWRHFETFNELMQPTYGSIFPPLQSLVLAFGQKVFGKPWVGVYLSAGLMCAAVGWMLQGWLPPNLAFLGGLLFVLRVGIFSYWMNSYWGGAVAAIGGSLVLGALPRIWRRAEPQHWIAFACGLAILMNSRPWEGVVLAAAALGVLAWAGRRPAPLGSVVPAVAILLVSLGAVAYLDYRVTGNPLLLPHALSDRQYMRASNFAFLPLREPLFAGHFIPDFYTGEQGAFTGVWRDMRRDPLDAILAKGALIYSFFFGFWPLLIPPLFWPYRLKTLEERAAVFLLLVFLCVATLPLTWLMMHYVAPIAGLFYVRFLQTLWRLHGWRPAGKPLGTAMAVFFVTLFCCQFGSNLSLAIHGGMNAEPFPVARNMIVQELARKPGRQLVLVRYRPDHDQLQEWVWNRADIDGSQTVWARAMDAENDRELIRYFCDRQPDRQVWMLDADQTPPRLAVYPGEMKP